MAFRIKNTITEDDYRAMVESLRETDGTEGRFKYKIAASLIAGSRHVCPQYQNR